MPTQSKSHGDKKKSARKSSAKEQRAKLTSAAADIVDRQLLRYQSMRDFAITPEPSGKRRFESSVSRDNLPFVIQKHAASHLHYDFRLAWNGVLKSWACAKGPSLYPGDRRLAIQVEDHPIEYGGFEGIIPAGQYGGGTVMLWDQGTWEPQPGYTDVDAALRDGSLKFTLHGKKLKGNWTLVRMGGKAAIEKKPNWLLIKEHDSFERSKDDPAITEQAPDSALTHRSLDQIAAAKDHVWNSGQTSEENLSQQKCPPSRPSPSIRAAIKKANSPSPALAQTKKESLPSFIAPQLATQVSAPPTTSGWVHELKLDGYRIQARLDNGKVELLTRNGLDWTHRMPRVVVGLEKLPVKSALLDGEVVVLRPDGTTSFADLQAAFQQHATGPLTYFVFDLLHLNGHNLRSLPLIERKTILASIMQHPNDEIRLSEHLDTDAHKLFAKACELHAEGIISKRADASYLSGRSSSWLKLKCIHQQEFVIAGFTLPANSHAGIHGIGSLLLGYYDGANRLIYAGRTGTGFTQTVHHELRTQLEKLRQSDSPLHHPPAAAGKRAIWVKPKLVAQVRFASWTADHLLRQASFQGLREDKPAADVAREPLTREPRAANKRASHPANASIAAKVVLATEHAPVRLTHPDKVLDPASNLTKQQLADYYWQVAPHMLQQIAGRPLSLVRCPGGSSKPCFFQKHITTLLPPGVEAIQVPNKKTGKLEPYIALSTPNALAALAQMDVLEVHPWGSLNKDLEHPDRIIFDLDPDAAISWPTLSGAAAQVRKRLKKLGLESFLKSTGGKGLHIVVPIDPQDDWATINRFAHNFALELEKSDPALYLSKMKKSARAGKIYLDYLRNERGATAIAAFSPRARPGTPVSLPLDWSDLRLKVRPLFHVADYSTWRSRLSRDPWKRLENTHQRLPRESPRD